MAKPTSKRSGWTFDRETFRDQMNRVCPADAQFDDDMQRLLNRIDEPVSKGANHASK